MPPSAPPPLEASPPLPPRTPPPPALVIPSPANSPAKQQQQQSSLSTSANTTSQALPPPQLQKHQQPQQPSIRINSEPVYAQLSSQHVKHGTSSSATATIDSQLRAPAEKHHLYGHHHRHHHKNADTLQPHKIKRSRSPLKLIRNIRTYFHGQRQKMSGRGSAPTSLTFGSPPPRPSAAGENEHVISNTAITPSTLSPLENHHPASNVNHNQLLNSAGSALPQVPQRPKNTATLDPEKQVLLLRVMSYFEHAGHPADEETAEYLLASYQWDISATLQYCQDLIEAVQGTLIPVNQDVALQGAVNDQMTSCYIDSLLFAMFARLSAFEGLLNVNLDGEDDSDSEDENTGSNGGTGGMASDNAEEEQRQEALLSQHRLQTWLRMFVNQLRQGRLVQAHVVRELRQHLYSCGWSIGSTHLQDSRLSSSPSCFSQQYPAISRQEDASELFMFLTEILHLPFLPLEQRLLHGARISDDDDKVITERMLQICIPTPEEQREQVKEHHHQEHAGRDTSTAAATTSTTTTTTTTTAPSGQPVPTKTRESRLSRFLNPRSNRSDKHQHNHASSSSIPSSAGGSGLPTHALPPLPPRPSAERSPAGTPELEILSLEKLLAQHFYDNTLTGIRRKVSSGTGAPLSPGVEIPVSAWQVLELLPFYSSSNEQGQQVVASRRQYPGDVVILPLILKRYSFGMDGQARRIGTPIEIPRRIDFSRFVNPGPARTNSTPLQEKSSRNRNNNNDSNNVDNADTTQNNADTQGAAPSYTPTTNTATAPIPTTSLVHSIAILQEEPESEMTSEPATPTIQPSSTTTTASTETDVTPTVPTGGSQHPDSPSLTINTERLVASTSSPLRKFSADKAGNFLARTLLDSPTVPDTPPPKYTPSSTLLLSAYGNDNYGSGDRKLWPVEEAAHEGIRDNGLSPNTTTTATTFLAPTEVAARSKVRYFLELKSVVCHLGSRLDSGHYRSYVANGPPPPHAYDTEAREGGSSNCSLNGNSSSSNSSINSATAEERDCEPDWLRHDDLDPSGKRVQVIPHDSDMNMEMESDWACNGYILFYELKTIRQ
ncbi:hypothetical protein BGW42_000453 [Actinomortierella wolfii]|nr:hypothetical protein BGW42_000453 [Actinomortierella wolfii]